MFKNLIIGATGITANNLLDIVTPTTDINPNIKLVCDIIIAVATIISLFYKRKNKKTGNFDKYKKL